MDRYEEGIDTVVRMDRYAGLLVSVHGSGLRRRRYDLPPSWSETPDPFRPFVEREENRQARLLDELLTAGDERMSAADAELLSTLHEPGTAPERGKSPLAQLQAASGPRDAVAGVFRDRSPPGYPRIDAAPTGANGSDAQLSVEATADGAYRVNPYRVGRETKSFTV